MPMDLRQMPPREETGPPPANRAESMELADYVSLVWRYKVFIVAAAIVAGVTMFAKSLIGPRVYESSVTFAATQSKIGEGGQAAASTASFRPMVESLTTAAAVLRDVGLDKPPKVMRPSEFLSQVMSVSEVRGTNLMRVTIVYTDPTLSATMANSVAAHAVQVARNVSAAEAVYARDMIKRQVDLARGRLDQSDARLREYRQQVRVEVVRKGVETLLGGPQVPVFPKGQPVFVEDPSGGRPGLLDLLVKIASEKARLVVIERDLASRSRVDVLTKTIDSEPALADARRQVVTGSGSTVGTQLRSESINEVYQGLDAAAATTRSNLASLEKQKAELMNPHKLDTGTLSVLDHLYGIESELARRQVDLDLAQKIYTDISQRYEVASLQVVGRSAELSVIDPAVPADRPVSRQVARNTVVAAMIGFVFAVAGVVLWHATRQMRYAPVR